MVKLYLKIKSILNYFSEKQFIESSTITSDFFRLNKGEYVVNMNILLLQHIIVLDNLRQPQRAQNLIFVSHTQIAELRGFEIRTKSSETSNDTTEYRMKQLSNQYIHILQSRKKMKIRKEEWGERRERKGGKKEGRRSRLVFGIHSKHGFKNLQFIQLFSLLRVL